MNTLPPSTYDPQPHIYYAYCASQVVSVFIFKSTFRPVGCACGSFSLSYAIIIVL